MTFSSVKQYISENYPLNKRKEKSYLEFDRNEFVLIDKGIMFKYILYSNGGYNIINIYDDGSLIYLNSDNFGLFTKSDCSFYKVSERELNSIKDESIQKNIYEFLKMELIKKICSLEIFHDLAKVKGYFLL